MDNIPPFHSGAHFFSLSCTPFPPLSPLSCSRHTLPQLHSSKLLCQNRVVEGGVSLDTDVPSKDIRGPILVTHHGTLSLPKGRPVGADVVRVRGGW
jgi:hypothetical protein